MTTITMKITMADGREIALESSVRNLHELEEATQKMRQVIEAFEKAEMPNRATKPSGEFIQYDRNCKLCKGKNCVTVTEDPYYPDLQRQKLYCSKCKKTRPLPVPEKVKSEKFEILVPIVQAAFKVARDKMYEDGIKAGNSELERLSKAETRIIQALIYG